MLFYLLIAVVSIVCGVILGQTKGLPPWTGFLLTFFLGPLGLLIVACLPNKKREKEEEEKRMLLEEQLQLQRIQIQQANDLAQSRILGRNSGHYPTPPKSLHISRNGHDLGEMKFAVIQTMLANKQLSPNDCYFDTQNNDWLPLECHPALA